MLQVVLNLTFIRIRSKSYPGYVNWLVSDKSLVNECVRFKAS